MSNILTEPSSQRADHKIWVWRYGDPVNIPMRVSFIRKDNAQQYFDVPTTCYVRFLIKSDLREDDPIIDKPFKFIKPNIVLVEFSTEEVIQLRAGRA